ncbi:hypothetical protein KP509_03G099600 [Ceratopteris richardii]|uniref:Uncharacterized protein n=1 Tax=Ceratopteris richardii TaxID=49495 RepID=A0A8T2VA90_CERRI|nr:hypothetical protein KP509_03G099600 [Ceratopteris richardii]
MPVRDLVLLLMGYVVTTEFTDAPHYTSFSIIVLIFIVKIPSE